MIHQIICFNSYVKSFNVFLYLSFHIILFVALFLGYFLTRVSLISARTPFLMLELSFCGLVDLVFSCFKIKIKKTLILYLYCICRYSTIKIDYEKRFYVNFLVLWTIFSSPTSPRLYSICTQHSLRLFTLCIFTYVCIMLFSIIVVVVLDLQRRLTDRLH